jgi:NAD(P)-dependent dehydrogenase (short-subunit alcohol dehydrogenase family)
MSKLSGKTAVVTGASKGIGAGIAKGLAAEGAAVVVNYAASKDGAERVVADIKAKGGKAIAVHGDVAKAADVKKIFATTKQALGRLDILVNNAGVYYKFLPLEEVTEEDFHRHFNINVLGLLLATKEAAKLFGDAGGSVINIGSPCGTCREFFWCAAWETPILGSQANGGNYVDQNGDAEEAAPRIDAAHHLVEGPNDQTASGDHLGHCR